MIVNRRTALKQFLVISAGVALIPSCMQDKSKASIILKNIDIDGEQEKLLAELSETIIPKTDTPGAKDISAHLFVLKMIDDCYGKEEQRKFVKGLKQFDDLAEKNSKRGFVESSQQQREAVLTEVESNNKSASEELNFFYNTVKHLSIQAYTTSKFYLTKVQVYELVPGAFKGSVRI